MSAIEHSHKGNVLRSVSDAGIYMHSTIQYKCLIGILRVLL